MLKINFCSISNVDKFFCLVEQSCGDVLMRLDETSFCNLKKDSMAAKILKQAGTLCHKTEIELSDINDGPQFIDFMLSGCK